MESQYALRFESGERRGEVVPLSAVTATGGAFTIGRKPGNSLQVTDPSVSGKHVELEVAGDSVAIRDLNSTNGTHIGGKRIRQGTLRHGDEFVLGAVEFTLLDTAISADAGPPGGGAADGELFLGEADDVVAAPAGAAVPVVASLSDTRMQPRDEALEITAEDLARSRKSSKLGPIVVVVLAAVGGGLWWWLGQGGDGDGRGGRRTAASAAVTPPAGNLIKAGYSFESTAGWSVDETLPATFDPVASARRSGRKGVRADVFGGDVAILQSDAVRLSRTARAVRATASLRGDAGGEFRLGLRFRTRDGSASTTVWSDALTPGEEWVDVRLDGSAPEGMDEVLVLVRGEGTGQARPAEDDAGDDAEDDRDSEATSSSIEVDDVALVAATDTGLEAVRHDEWSVTPVGGSAGGRTRAISVSSLDRLMISSIRVVTAGGPLDLADLTVVDGADGTVRITTATAGEVVVRAEAEIVGQGVATMGAEGYAAHGTSFDRLGTTDLLLGVDATLIRVTFDSPVDVTARPAGDDLVVRGRIAAGSSITIQVEFKSERTDAERIARRAQEARRNGNSGESLRIWSELLGTVPFSERLVGLAATEQSELLAEGRSALKQLADEVERARFFGLADLFRMKLERASELGATFAGTEIEAQCDAAADEIKLELARLDAGRDHDEHLRLEAIEAVLRKRGAEKLAARVEEYKEAEGGGL